MKINRPVVGRVLALAESNPVLILLLVALAVPLLLVYAALSFVTATLSHFVGFICVGALALLYSAWIAHRALRHWEGRPDQKGTFRVDR